MTGSVIDLGELRHGPDPDPLPRPPRANGRQLRYALALLLVLVTVGAAAAPPPRRTVLTLPVRPGSDVLIDGDLLLTIDSQYLPASQRRLNAFRLPGGERVWHAPLPAEAKYWGITPLAEMLLLTGYEIGPKSDSTLTVALDRATGAYRWQQPGSPRKLADGNLLLQSGRDDEPASLRVVDPCCGTMRWQLLNAVNWIDVRDAGPGADRVVLTRVDGQTEVRDAATGTVLARADLRPPGGGPPDFVQVLDELLLTIGGEPTTITAYGLDRLDRRWTSTSAPVEFATDCGPVLCVRTSANEMQAIDVATGELRWSSDRWRWGWPYEGRLMVSVSGSGALERYLVLDALTGRQVADLGQWELTQLQVGGPPVGIRRHPDGGMVVGKLDIRAGQVRVLDVLPDAVGDCQAIVDHLLCVGANGSYQLWTLPD
ncbi:PQQ-binding-like beta-propeller repeat protein [Micromonospora chokoriensis]|uniref:outer membrane protein assembly factor BamB family protein n=1 Tax=Micromonospora chokoriensis TaxID=356851 RepID=UPI000A426B95|nr:PQQ-binding-like beta-propeller repeat protein [Micromonospora chokoriensis]